jgi:hypothetical protein
MVITNRTQRNPRRLGYLIAEFCLFAAYLWAATLSSSHVMQSACGQELRVVEGRYVRLISDVTESALAQNALQEGRPPATNRLPVNLLEDWVRAFDAAVPQWCQFWQVPLERVDRWRVTMYVMGDKERFRREGLIPAAVPDFPHGYQWGDSAWVVLQPGDYYTRHLILHEGVHALAATVFEGAGPPWFMEGTAEYLATHRWDGERIEVGIVPESKDRFPFWGRFKMIDQRRTEQRALSLISVMRYSDTAHRQVEPYAWTWAATQLLASYPETRGAMIEMAYQGSNATPEFTRQFVEKLGPQWPLAQTQWRVLLDEFDYGYDTERNRLDLMPSEPIWSGEPFSIDIQASRGWQSAGRIIPAGTILRIQSSGRVTLAYESPSAPGAEPRPWISEPNGVTLRYWRGRPLGKLLATTVPIQPIGNDATSVPLDITPIGADGTIKVEVNSRLLLKVGDVPAELSDNQGHFTAEIISSLP